VDQRVDAVHGGVKCCAALVLHVLSGHHLHAKRRLLWQLLCVVLYGIRRSAFSLPRAISGVRICAIVKGLGVSQALRGTRICIGSTSNTLPTRSMRSVQPFSPTTNACALMLCDTLQ
jgi:hypothetical protein